MIPHNSERALLPRYLSASTAPIHVHQGGFSFLELLISLLIFAIGFIGLASLQSLSIKMTHDSILQASAVSLSSSLIDQLRVKGNTFDLSPWKTLASKELPNGKVELLNQAGTYELNISWQESEHSSISSNTQHYVSKFSVKE